MSTTTPDAEESIATQLPGADETDADWHRLPASWTEACITGIAGVLASSDAMYFATQARYRAAAGEIDLKYCCASSDHAYVCTMDAVHADSGVLPTPQWYSEPAKPSLAAVKDQGTETPGVERTEEDVAVLREQYPHVDVEGGD